MATIDQTVDAICNARSFNARIAEIRKVRGKHGSDDHVPIFAEVARRVYVPHLAPNFAFINVDDFYSAAHFNHSYGLASAATNAFTQCDIRTLAELLETEPHALLVLRTICGLTKGEFSVVTKMVDQTGKGVSDSSIDNMEKNGTRARNDTENALRARILASALVQVMTGQLFGSSSPDFPTKQEFKPDSENGWASAAQFAQRGVPYPTFLHQRHYGGAFRQLLDATSSSRGDLLEDAVEEIFKDNGIPYIRTGSHNQGDPYARFGLSVRPAPDFVVYDETSGHLMAMLECKTINDGGTARDKALRFAKLKAESVRLGGIALMAVLGGLGWRRVNDALGPVVDATDGRVFTLSTLTEVLSVAPMPRLMGTASTSDDVLQSGARNAQPVDLGWSLGCTPVMEVNPSLAEEP